MKSFSLFSIVLLCLAIVLIDILAFYWLQSITNLIVSATVKTIINVLFWSFTIGLVTAILVLKIILDDINPKQRQLLISSFYGLTVLSFVPKIIFVIVISALYITNHLLTENESLVVVPIIGLLSGILPFIVIVYGIFRSVYRFKVSHHRLVFKQLPRSFTGLRIIQISDLHLGSFNYRYKTLEKAIAIINDLKPDLILFTGDLVNNYAWELTGWNRILAKLQANMGKYAILGNHDYGDYSTWKSEVEKMDNFKTIKQFFNKINFELLLDESVDIKKNHDSITLIGVENWGRPPFKQYGNLRKALEKVETTAFKILLSHDPSHWSQEVVQKTNIALTLSGHTHGMQVGFAYKNKAWSPIKYKYKHWGGLYQHENQYLYVNKGLGWIGFPGRLGMRPEITFFELFNNDHQK